MLIAAPIAYVSAAQTSPKAGGNKWLLNKAVVKSVDIAAKTITVTKNSVDYVVDYSNARLVRKYNATADISEILVGDFVKIFGKINGTNVTAKRVKDLSIQKFNGKFHGTIKSIDTTDNSFVLQTKKRGDQTVEVSSTTKIRYKSTTKAFSDLAVGNRVIIKGTWNSTHKLAYNVTSIKITRQ
jgi:Cu/Ag efflux protein CusF